MLIEFKKNLRKNLTYAESILWQQLRNRNFLGFKFRRQFIIPPYIVDFVCLEKRLVIELDGSQHMDNVEYDNQRTLFLNENDFKVVRFWNNDVLKNLDSVLGAILRELN